MLVMTIFLYGADSWVAMDDDAKPFQSMCTAPISPALALAGGPALHGRGDLDGS